jgi:dUTP pyrophosphatase
MESKTFRKTGLDLDTCTTTKDNSHFENPVRCEEKLLCMQLHPEAKIPCRSYAGDAGFDLAACFPNNQYPITLSPGQRCNIPTGIAVSCPQDVVYLVRPRSGLARKYGISVLAGVVDSNYRGEVIVILQNLGQDDLEISQFDKIAQLVPVKLPFFTQKSLTLVDRLEPSERDTKGFGSSGVNG